MSSTSRWSDAYRELDEWLTRSFDGVSRLGHADLRRYPNRSFEGGWRVPLWTSSSLRKLDLLVGPSFPFEPPRLALVDPPSPLTWPHLEEDHCICLLSDNEPVAVDQPIDVTKLLLSEAATWLEESEAGANVEDFRAEFLSYWRPAAGTPQIRSLLRGRGPSRAVVISRGKDVCVVADDEATLQPWLKHVGGNVDDVALALLAWLDQPMLPRDYPSSTAAVVDMVRTAGLGPNLDEIASATPDRIVVLIGANARAGPVFAGIVLQPTRGRSRGTHGGSGSFLRGFRPGHVPSQVLAQRVLDVMRPARARVERVDASWVHGRDADADLVRLRACRVAIVGCGSLGSAVALALAQVGVGSIDLIDPQGLSAANTGRHALGALQVGQSKAPALAERIGRTFPHVVHVQGHCARWEIVASETPRVLEDAELVVSTIASWSSEGALNAWRLDLEGKPDLLLGWLEPHAVAGHAVALVAGLGCLACGFSSSGASRVQVADWPSGTGHRAEPACGITFQPYGPIEAAHVVALIAESAVDILLARLGEPTHRVWVAREAFRSRAGAVLTPQWIARHGAEQATARVFEEPWVTAADCCSCGAVDRD